MEKTDDFRIVGAEVYEVLNNIPKEQYNKIPTKITSIFEKFKNIDTKPIIDINKTFAEQEISKKSKDIIFYISFNYWLTEKQKEEVLKKMKTNEEELNKKYSTDNLFKDIKKENIIDKKDKIDVINKKKKWYLKLLDKIRKIFKRN